MRANRARVVVFALAVGAAACSSSASIVNTPPGVNQAARVGATLGLTARSGAQVGITLAMVADPAHDLTGAESRPGRRLVATVFRILNAAQPVSGNPRADARVVGADGQDYLPTANTVVECSGDLTGHFQLAPGASTTACTAFELPSSVRVEKVDYLPSAGTANDYGEWLVP